MIKEVLSEANEELRTDECITTKKTKKMKTATEKEIAIMKKELEKRIALRATIFNAAADEKWKEIGREPREGEVKNQQRLVEMLGMEYREGWFACLRYLKQIPWNEAIYVICEITDEHKADTGRKEDDSDEA